MSRKRLQCWEAMGCGCGPGGARVHELGVCPAALPGTGDGLNGGRARGRICWAVAGTLCHPGVEMSRARRLAACLACPFYLRVQEEEGRALVLLPPGSGRISEG